MAYIDPKMVLSPKALVKNIRVLYDGGESEFSVVELEWDGEPAVGMRWNGGMNNSSPMGNPQSRGVPTWFIVPDELADIVKNEAIRLNAGKRKK